MHGGTLQWLARTLVVSAMFGLTAVASGQGYLEPTGSAYDTPDEDSYLVSNNNTNAGKPSLADQVADLKAWQEEVLEKQAADKKAAAGKPTVKLGGRFFYDWAMFDQSAGSVAIANAINGGGGDIQNGMEARTAWLYAAGTAFQVFDYKFQVAFEPGDGTTGRTAFKDVYFTVNELPLLSSVRVGHFKEPFSLEQLTASKYISFMERSLADVFVPSRNVGVMAFGNYADERATWAIGAFGDQNPDRPPQVSDDHQATALTMRATYLPWYDEGSGGRGLLHTGMGYSYRDAHGDSVRFRTRPEAHLAQYMADTGVIANVDDYQLFNAELAYVYGPFSVQSEYITTFVDVAGAGNPQFDGFYAYTSYFLTGENRTYKKSAGAFAGIKPHENFFRVRDEDGCIQTGKGAWEVLYRYSYLDLNDAGITGGRLSDHTIGLNWYLSPYTRVMWDLVNSDANYGGTEGTVNAFMMRAQMHF